MKIVFDNSSRVELGIAFLQKDIREDRGSRYGVVVAGVKGKHDLISTLNKLMQDTYFSEATHNSWAMIVDHEGVRHEFTHDDGETGAGKVILREIQKADMTDCVVVVTRHFGGIKLERDRYTHVQEAAREGIKQAITQK